MHDQAGVVLNAGGVVMVVVDSVAVKRHSGEAEQQCRGGLENLSPARRRRQHHCRARRRRDAACLAIDNVLALHNQGAGILLDGVFKGHDQQITSRTPFAGVTEQTSATMREHVGLQRSFGPDLPANPHPAGEVDEQRARA